MIKGIHHISMRCGTPEELKKVREFYLDALGLKICRQWEGGLMIDTGAGLLEIFTNRAGEKAPGAIGHFALLTDDVDAAVEKVKAAGYEVYVGPADAVIRSDPEYPIRMAFVHGPLGEEVELFCER